VANTQIAADAASAQMDRELAAVKGEVERFAHAMQRTSQLLSCQVRRSAAFKLGHSRQPYAATRLSLRAEPCGHADAATTPAAHAGAPADGRGWPVVSSRVGETMSLTGLQARGPEKSCKQLLRSKVGC